MSLKVHQPVKNFLKLMQILWKVPALYFSINEWVSRANAIIGNVQVKDLERGNRLIVSN